MSIKQQREQHKKACPNNYLSFQGFYQRIYQGWDIEKAINTPKKEDTPKRFKYYEEHQDINGKYSVDKNVFYLRIYKYGWSIEKAIMTPNFRNKKLI